MAAWYRAGTVAVENGSPSVVGTTTAWLNQVRAGDPFRVDGDPMWYEILSVEDNTHLTLATDFEGSTDAELNYAIQRRTPEWTFSTELATKVGEILARRSLILHGIGAPSSALGEDGYFYIDSAANELYGPKDEGAWGDPVLMTGLDAGLRFVWDTDTATSDPGAGGVKANHGTAGSMTSLFISETDADGNSIAAELARWYASTSTIKARLILRKLNTPGVMLMLNVTAGADNGDWRTLTVASGVLNGVLADGDAVAVVGIVTGDAGADGTDPGYLFTFETATSSPPSAGGIRGDNADLSAATVLYVSKTSRGGSNIAARLLELDPGSKTEPNTIILTDPVSEAQASFVVDAVNDDTGFVEIEISGHVGATVFSAGAISLQRDISGADGGGVTTGKAIAMAIVFG